MRHTFALALLLALHAAGARATVIGDPFLCHRARAATDAPASTSATPLATADRFGIGSAAVGAPTAVCAPATVDGVAPATPTIALVERRAGRDRGVGGAHTGLSLTTQLGTMTVDVLRQGTAQLPATTDAQSDPPTSADVALVNHYRCYAARRTPGTAAPMTSASIEIGDGLGGTRRYDLRALRQVCTPLALGDGGIAQAAASLACFRVRAQRGQPTPSYPAALHVRDDLGVQQLSVGPEDLLCLPATLDDGRCNGDAALCARRYDQVAYPTTHNAMSNADEGWSAPNQQHGIAQQLDDGIRGLMLDTHYDGGAPFLCHELCILGKEPLPHGLAKIRRFLDLHPQEVVTIIFESYIDESDVAASFAAAGLLDYVHTQPLGTPWATLRELIDARHRLVVFTDERGVLPWHHYVWDYASETPFSFVTPADLSCRPNRGDPANSLFILNHFLTNVVGNRMFAEEINYDPLFIDRAEQCQTERNRLPNFVTVDFYDVGDVFAVARTLNGL